MKYLRIPITVVTVALLLSGCITVPAPQPAAQQPAAQEPAVQAPAATEAPPAVIVVTATPNTTSNTSAGCSDSAQLESQEPQVGDYVQAGSSFEMKWTVLNTGTCTWDSKYKLIFADGDELAALKEVQPLVKNTIPPGSNLTIFITMQASEAGQSVSNWKWVNGNGSTLLTVSANIVVP